MMNGLNTFIAQWSFPLWQTLGTAFLLLAAFFGTGKAVLRFFTKENFTSFAAGCALFMMFFALLPSKRGVLLAATLPFALWGIREFLPLLKGNWGKVLFLFLLFLAFLGSALLPPYAWDEQTYQLALPLRHLQSGSFAPVPDNPYSFYPPLTNWFFANLITLGGVELPRIIVGSVTPLLLLAVWRMTVRFGKVTAAAAVAALLFSPLFLNMNRAVYVENFIALFTVGGVIGAWHLRKKGFAAPMVCGLLAGAAFAVKPTGAVGGVLLFILFFSVKEWKKCLCFCGTAFLFAFFWYLRTFLETGNFFYPYALAPLPGSVEHFHKLLGSARYGLEGVPGALLNWLFAGFDRKLFDGITTGFHIPALGAAAFAGALLARKSHPSFSPLIIRGLLAFMVPLFLWSILFPQSRFVLPLLPFAAASGVIVIKRSPWSKAGFLISGILLAGTIIFQSSGPLRHYFVSWRILEQVRKAPGCAMGSLTRDPGLYKSFETLAVSTPPGAKTLLLMERRGLYCPRPYAIACPGFEPSLTPVPETPEKLFEKLRSFDYIIVGNTTQDVDLQSANASECEKVFIHLKELLEKGKLKRVPCDGYPVLQVVKEERV